MEWFPDLKLAWLNGWVLLCSFYALFGLLLLAFPREVVQRLYDQTGWSKSQRTMSTLAKLFALVSFVLIFLTPLKIESVLFFVGVVVYALGVVLMALALITFRRAPLDRPVMEGVYRRSRNPQWEALVMVMLGIAFAIVKNQSSCTVC